VDAWTSKLARNDWVRRAGKALRRNTRLACASCFVRFKGHAYVDTPEYNQVAIKWVQYGLGLEDCAEPDHVEANSFLSVQTLQHNAKGAEPEAASKGRREPFAYATFSPYGPQCYDLATLGACLSELQAQVKLPLSCASGLSNTCAIAFCLPATALPLEAERRSLFAPPSALPLGLSPEIDLHLRLWETGNASVGFVNCALDPDPSKPRETYYPFNAALGPDNSTHYTTIKTVRMAKPLLLPRLCQRGQP
jgi:hypothetical protein